MDDPHADTPPNDSGSKEKAPSGTAPEPAVAYSRRLYDDVLGWYRSADAKAQVVIGLDGAFLAFITAAAFRKPDELASLFDTFLPLTWQLLGLMAVTLVASMMSSIYCLWSRVYIRPSDVVASILARSGTATGSPYPPGVMWFFQLVARLDEDVFRQTLLGVNGRFEIEALSSQIAVLSKNVRRKHIAANVGFALAIVTLLLFAGAATSYGLAARSAG
jgi:hypothetical protein